MSEMEQAPRAPSPGPSDALPLARVRRRRSPSLVWLIPLVALGMGGWLAIKTLVERGPIIHIALKTATGLTAGQTKVKFKDVDVGQVTAIDVSPDLKRVLVTAELKNSFTPFLTDQTRFWVERPRVTYSGVSGLETLLSGPYIAMDPGGKGRSSRHFEGLEEPPLFTAAEPGTQVMLRAASLGSLNIGSPVYYRRFQVGQVVGYALDPDGAAVSIEVFIFAPHDQLITAATRFWNASGVDVSLTGSGIQVDTESLLSILIGGLAFDSLDTIDAPKTGPRPQIFPLYANRDAAYARSYARKERYLLFFEGSVWGLTQGSPVLLKGIDIGRVLDIQLQLDATATRFRIPVLIEIEPERIQVQGEAPQPEATALVEHLVAQGLHGQLKITSLLTGELHVDLDVYPEAAGGQVVKHGGYAVIPTRPTPLETVTNKVAGILEKLDALPIAQIGEDLSATVAGANRLISSDALSGALRELEGLLREARATTSQLNAEIVPALTTTLRETQTALAATQTLVSERSPLQVEAQRALRDLGRAAAAIRGLADYLERHPEALLQGKERR